MARKPNKTAGGIAAPTALAGVVSAVAASVGGAISSGNVPSFAAGVAVVVLVVLLLILCRVWPRDNGR